ncbi:MAG: ABC transporter ATP-binding protein [Brockia lithotrophica]|nr:ABC transporter ATP-binding protein [Brockia lithotrophica]
MPQAIETLHPQEPPPGSRGPLLRVEDLDVDFHTFAGVVQAVRGVSFELGYGETLAIVGESGSGKSVTAQAILGLLPQPPARIRSGRILFGGRNLLELTEREWENVRGREIAMVFQDPMTALNPTMTIGRQISEGYQKHMGAGAREAEEWAVELLRLVGIPQPEIRIRQYPHEFSGGMRQRVVIAIALAARPKLIIADEPTTALDVTIQAQILELLMDLKERFGTSLILITHDLGVVARVADRVLVMYAGEAAEWGSAEEVFAETRHPYTWGLLNSLPRLDKDRREPLLSIPGSPPNLLKPPPGCAFHPRCPFAMEICRQASPPEYRFSPTHGARCFLHHPAAPRVAPDLQGGERA